MRRAGLLLVLAGCGKIGFAPIAADAAIDGPGGEGLDAAVDAALLDAAAVTVTFGDDPTAMVRGGTRDTFLSNETNEALLNNGTSDVLRIEQDVSESALLAFDLSAIPPTATVVAASLRLTITQANPAASIAPRQVLEDWQEGTGDGTPGEANYFNRRPGQAWTTPGAGGPGSSAPPTFSFVPDPATTLMVTLPAALVQGWVSDPATNHGLLFASNSGETSRFASREAAPGAARPQLAVTFQP